MPELSGRLVLDGAVVEVPDERGVAYLCQESTWAPADKAAKDALAAYLAPPEEPEQGEGSDD